MFPYELERSSQRSDRSNLQQKREALATIRQKIIPDSVLAHPEARSRWLVVPDGLINFVPFAALIDRNGAHLIDRFTIYSTPAITTALVLEQSADAHAGMGKPADVEVIALPGQEDVREIKTAGVFEPLSGAKEETLRILQILRGEINPIFPPHVKGDLPILHLATHGFFANDDPLLSFVILREGELYARQLYFSEMDISTGLVVMSAGQTGLGYTHPDSLLGLGNGFLKAGARSVIATLWEISDDGTLELMDHFYRNLKAGGTISDALRRAQLALKSKEAYEDPYFWAPFQHIGLDRNPLPVGSR